MQSIYKFDKQEDLVTFTSSGTVSLVCRAKSSKRASNETTRFPIEHNLVVGGCNKYLTSKGKESIVFYTEIQMFQ